MPAKKRKDGLYEITAKIGNTKKHFYGQTPELAEEKMWREKIKYKDNYEDYVPSSDSFGEVRKKWYRAKSPKQAATRKMYEVDCFRKIEVLDNKPIGLIDEYDIKKIMDPLVDKTNIAEKVYMCLNQIFKYARTKKIILYNPMELVERPKNKTKEKSKRGLTKNEKIVISNTIWNQRQEILLKLFLDYGLRKEEAAALKKKNINLENKTISIEHAMDYTTNIPKLKSTKSIAGKRKIPILEQDLKFFERTIEDLKEEEHLLRMSKGNPLSNNSYRQLWDSIRRRMAKTAKEMKLEIPDDLTSRICRHEYSIKIMNLTSREQMYLMGHEDISTTMKNYQTINVEHINRKELNKISKIKNGSLSSGKNK